jgi:hypothetical protein
VSYATVRAALADTLAQALPKVNVFDTPADTIVAPAVIVASIKRSGAETFDPTNRLAVDLLLLVPRRNTSDYRTLDALCEPDGPMSVQAALEADSTLGGAVGGCHVDSVEQDGSVEVGGTDFYGAAMVVQVML